MSPCFQKMRLIDKSTSSKKWLKLVANLSRAQASLLFQLRSGHIGLNKHLHQIKQTASPACNNCNNGTEESIQHYLFECVKYSQERHLLQRSLQHHTSNLAYLLSSPDAMLPLLKFIHTLRLLKQTFGEVHSATQ